MKQTRKTYENPQVEQVIIENRVQLLAGSGGTSEAPTDDLGSSDTPIDGGGGL